MNVNWPVRTLPNGEALDEGQSLELNILRRNLQLTTEHFDPQDDVSRQAKKHNLQKVVEFYEEVGIHYKKVEEDVDAILAAKRLESSKSAAPRSRS